MTTLPDPIKEEIAENADHSSIEVGVTASMNKLTGLLQEAEILNQQIANINDIDQIDETQFEEIFLSSKQNLEDLYAYASELRNINGDNLLGRYCTELVFGKFNCHIVKHDLQKTPTLLLQDLGMLIGLDFQADEISKEIKIKFLQDLKNLYPKAIEGFKSFQSIVGLSQLLGSNLDGVDKMFFSTFASFPAIGASIYLLNYYQVNFSGFTFVASINGMVLKMGENEILKIELQKGFSLSKLDPEIVFFIHTFILNACYQFTGDRKRKKEGNLLKHNWYDVYESQNDVPTIRIGLVNDGETTEVVIQESGITGDLLIPQTSSMTALLDFVRITSNLGLGTSEKRAETNNILKALIDSQSQEGTKIATLFLLYLHLDNLDEVEYNEFFKSFGAIIQENDNTLNEISDINSLIKGIKVKTNEATAKLEAQALRNSIGLPPQVGKTEDIAKLKEDLRRNVTSQKAWIDFTKQVIAFESIVNSEGKIVKQIKIPFSLATKLKGQIFETSTVMTEVEQSVSV